MVCASFCFILILNIQGWLEISKAKVFVCLINPNSKLVLRFQKYLFLNIFYTNLEVLNQSTYWETGGFHTGMTFSMAMIKIYSWVWYCTRSHPTLKFVVYQHLLHTHVSVQMDILCTPYRTQDVHHKIHTPMRGCAFYPW